MGQIADAVEEPGRVTMQELRSVEAQTKEVVESIQSATVSITSGFGRGTGVIIREDGLVLTAAHVAGGVDDQLMVTMADGTELSARVLGCDHEHDIALALILDQGEYPYADLADTVTPGQWCIALGHPGGRTPDRSAVLRVSRVSDDEHTIVGRSGFSSTASLINGDSGGPLFDLEGRVIGIHQSVNPFDTERSYHASVETVHERMAALLARQEFGTSIFDRLGEPMEEAPVDTHRDEGQSGELPSKATQRVVRNVQDLSELPEHVREMIESREGGGSDSPATDSPTIADADSSSETPKTESTQARRVLRFELDPNDRGRTEEIVREQLREMGIDRNVRINGLEETSASASRKELLLAVESATEPWNQSTARIFCDGARVAIGAVIDRDGYLVTKASELSGSISVEINGDQYEAVITAIDQLNDIAIIKVSAVDLVPIEWADFQTPPVGTFVAVAGASDAIGFGAVSHADMAQRGEPSYSKSELLGIQIDRNGRVAQVMEVALGGPAALAGVESGDLILTVNGEPVSNRASFELGLRQSTKGSAVMLSCLSEDGEVGHYSLVLDDGHLRADEAGLQARETLRVVSQISGQVSDRSGDFPLVFLHDSAIRAIDCGGVLTDLDGRVIGLNIARLDRTSTVAIPGRHAAQVIDRMLEESR
tara:strand:- start:415944 stop:417914 length:1971 start_codon:yes stop_codon:yes gene_type:complete